MNKVVITHAQTVTSLGHGLDTLYNGLLDAKNGFCPVHRFDTSPYVSGIAGIISGLDLAGGSLKKTAIMDLAADLIRDMPDPDPDSLLITASTKGSIDLIKNLPPCPDLSHGDFPGLPVSDLPGRLSRTLRLGRTGFNISAACSSSTIALAKAADLIRRGREHTVVVMALDLVTEFVFSGFSAIGAMGPGPAMPFDRDRKGLTLGDGAAVMVLSNQNKAMSDGTPILAELAGWGIAADAVHLTAPDRAASGLKTAILHACRTADITPGTVKVVCAHGTGTVYNDAMELTAIRDLFNPDSVMANSIKGSIGHTLGASGAIEAALCIKYLDQLILPGTKGLVNPDQGAAPIFSAGNRPFAKGPILTSNSGFGGINAALIIQEAS
ncbi:beta-ketoacyl synthase N-terminal-like domain-containing protein [uncultured Desulfobacter sp.]|uniref:beta-ketoacyl synthase N-terminal-like domain-containing protein n=1 Tax=uncultured Desulfobacter sp. TaxID=240139 RepID=UPI002AAC0963|nr:beta-ketoacyl synthase N-terminal-like domain-containing protein [uncultured Desulfobacter sp.]